MAGEPELLARIEADAGIDEPTASFWLRAVVTAIVGLLKTGEAVEVPGLGVFGPAVVGAIEPPAPAGSAPMTSAPETMVSERQINFIADKMLMIGDG